jgi:hypothetical protein
MFAVSAISIAMTIKPRDRSLERWKLLRERYQNRGLVLALGAGVSVGCKIPNWPNLLCRMGDRCLGPGGYAVVGDLIKAGMTLPAVAGILESKCPKNARFIDLLSAEIYRDFPFHDVISERLQRHKLVKFVEDSNPTMRAVTALCAQRSANNKFLANDQVRAVVNFNVDSILRTYARSRYETFLFRTIESVSKLAKTGRIPIYHMHGFLKFYKSDRQDDGEEVRCVFTEGEYYDFFNRPNSLFNYTFLFLLREYNCLFIGMSMTDENIRRLLHYSTSERRERAKQTGKESTERLALRHFCILLKSGSATRDRLTDISLRRLGTRVLWITDFEEIPKWLAYVYGEAGWQNVY